MSLKIEIGEDNSILKTKSVEIEDVFSIAELAEEMHKTLEDVGGVGLSAPQIGKNIRMFVMNYKGLKWTVINPVILDHGYIHVTLDEECLSLPGVKVPVKRYSDITVSFIDENGIVQRKRIKWMFARIFQHEYDHLEGVLITNYLLEEQ